MTLYPAAQHRAQAELDAVLGRSTFPALADCTSGRLPYVCALQKEVLRWNVAIPMGVPHVTTEEDVYERYRIPKGAAVLPNVW